MENITAAEMVAVEALLQLAGVRYEPNIQSNSKIDSQQAFGEEQRQVKPATIVTSTPHPKPLKKRPYIEVTDEPSSNFNAFVGKCEVFSPVLNKIIVPKPIFKLTPKEPVKSNSGRIIKRTRRFIAESEEKVEVQIQSPKRSKGTKITFGKNIMIDCEESKGTTHPAKKIKIEPDCEEEEPKVTIELNNSTKSSGASKKNRSYAKLKRDLFNTNITELVQSDKIRHSRLFEAAYELQNCTTADANVEFQYRAVENLISQKSEIDTKRRHISMNPSSKATEWMQKFRGIKHRQQVCNEFSSKFCSTKSVEWKPFTEDASRSTDISNYKMLQTTKEVAIKYWTQQFLTQKRGKEASRSMLIEIIKLLPNRPEVRHDFINGHLPKLVAAQKQATKKNKGVAIKEEILDLEAAFPYYL